MPGSQEDPHSWISVVLIVQPANPLKRREGEKSHRRRAFRKFPSKNRKKKKKDFLRLVIESEHDFNHILPSAGWGSSVAQPGSLAGTIFQLEVNDSNDNSCCWERTKCESELKIPGPSSDLFRRSVNTQLSSWNPPTERGSTS